MTAKDILAKVKAVFDLAPTAPADTTAPGSSVIYKLSDGSEISIELKDPAVNAEPSVGDKVSIGGVPAPEGVLTLEDGSTLAVDATGAISAIVEQQDPTTQDLSQAPAAPSVEERLAQIEAAVSRLTAPAQPAGMATEKDLQAATQRIAKQDEVIKGLFELVEKLTELPSEDPKTLTGAKKDQFDKANKINKKFEGITKALVKHKSLN